MAKSWTTHRPWIFSGDCGAFVTFKTAAGEAIEVRTGISLVSVEDARLNLEQELAKPFGWDFAAVVQNQRRVWNDLFDRIEIQTPDAREKTRFYSSMYRAFSGRNIWSDVNGKWIDPFGRPQQLSDPDAVMLGSDALWTTFWSLNQLMNLVAPEWSVRWTESELQLYDKCGWLAKGPAGLKYIAVMVAEHEIPLMVAAYQHGLKVDAAKILAASVKMQTTLPQRDLPGGGAAGNEHLENYLKYGYVAENGPRGPGGGYGGTSRTVPTPTNMPTTTGASGNWPWPWGAATWRRSSCGAGRTGATSSTLCRVMPVRA